MILTEELTEAPAFQYLAASKAPATWAEGPLKKLNIRSSDCGPQESQSLSTQGKWVILLKS